jgi:hypothetical protein
MRYLAGTPLAIVGLLAILAASSADGAQPALEPGLWRITVTSTTNGKPDPVQDSQECLGDELKDIAAYFAPQLENGEADCTRTQEPPKGRELTYRMQCRGAGFTVDALTGATVHNSRHFTVTMRINTKTEQESAIVVGKGEGHRTGVCPKQ